MAFWAWCCLVLSLVVFAAWNATVNGEPPWFFVAWTAGLLFLGLYSTSLEVVLAPDGTLLFRGLLRHRTWYVTDLRTVRPGTACIVFTFERGSAMVASSHRDDWQDLCWRIKRLNPRATLNLPGMFRPPVDRGTDTDD